MVVFLQLGFSTQGSILGDVGVKKSIYRTKTSIIKFINAQSMPLPYLAAFGETFSEDFQT
jgi:hypothetical protein